MMGKNIKTIMQLCTIACLAFSSGIATVTHAERRLLRQPEPRIIGGTAVQEDSYPFLVGLFNRNSKGKLEHLCGATLIAPDVVLSAAHCASDPTPDVVQIGRHNIEDDNELFEMFDIIEIVKHRNHVYDTDEHDLVLFKIPRSGHSYIRLNEDPNIPRYGDSMTVMGWGEDKSGDYPDVPHEASVDFVQTSKCKDIYEEELFEDHMLCAIGEDGEDNCSGDSGGPLVLKDDNTLDYSLVGVVSWGWECGDRDFPSVYISVSAEIDWIKQTLCELTDDGETKANICNEDITVQSSNIVDTFTATANKTTHKITCTKQVTLTDTTWLATMLTNQAVLFDAEITLYFDQNGTMNISSICNKYQATYEVKEGQAYVKVGGFMTSTDRLCSRSTMEEEYDYLRAIARTRAYSVECSKLNLLDEKNSVLLSFVADNA